MKFNEITLFLLVVIMTSCTIIDLENPLKGKITLTTDWSNRTEGIEIPANYTVIIDNQTLTFNNITNSLPELEAGTYPIRIYNTADKITISGTSVTVATTGNVVDPLPGWLFTALTEAAYTDFKIETIRAVMQQQIRQLTIELTVTEGDPERIASTAATLTGIANSLDFKTNTYSGTSLSVAPVFTRSGNKLTTSVRLLGTTNEVQKLSLKLKFTDNREQIIESEVSSQLVYFNLDKHIPLIISGNLNTPIEVGMQGTINGWTNTPNSSGTAW